MISLSFSPEEMLDPWLPIESPSKTNQTVDGQADLSLILVCTPTCTICWTPAHSNPFILACRLPVDPDDMAHNEPSHLDLHYLSFHLEN